MKQLRILIADDQPEVRAALRLLLGLQFNMLIIGEATEAKELDACLEQTTADMLFLDWELPGLLNLERLCAIRKLAPHLRIVALSGLPEARQQALAAGVDTFISKTDPPDVLVKALRSMDIDTPQ